VSTSDTPSQPGLQAPAAEPRQRRHLGLLPKILIAIVLGIVCGFFFPQWLLKGFATFHGPFGH